uniref:NADH dehydrogenase subunit 6 n=1 Tax=Knipowitschia caucasica TaxID=637954 RepID=A0AAV2MF87_KNICA
MSGVCGYVGVCGVGGVWWLCGGSWWYMVLWVGCVCVYGIGWFGIVVVGVLDYVGGMWGVGVWCGMVCWLYVEWVEVRGVS